jgi:hypothetical protein
MFGVNGRAAQRGEVKAHIPVGGCVSGLDRLKASTAWPAVGHSRICLDRNAVPIAPLGVVSHGHSAALVVLDNNHVRIPREWQAGAWIAASAARGARGRKSGSWYLVTTGWQALSIAVERYQGNDKPRRVFEGGSAKSREPSISHPSPKRATGSLAPVGHAAMVKMGCYSWSKMASRC